MAELEGKRALVTGGAQGLGKAIATLFVERGAKVMVSDIDEGGAKLTADELGESCRAVKCDVTSIFDHPEVLGLLLNRPPHPTSPAHGVCGLKFVLN